MNYRNYSLKVSYLSVWLYPIVSNKLRIVFLFLDKLKGLGLYTVHFSKKWLKKIFQILFRMVQNINCTVNIDLKSFSLPDFPGDFASLPFFQKIASYINSWTCIFWLFKIYSKKWLINFFCTWHFPIKTVMASFIDLFSESM